MLIDNNYDENEYKIAKTLIEPLIIELGSELVGIHDYAMSYHLVIDRKYF